jgi:hypothetical protein
MLPPDFYSGKLLHASIAGAISHCAEISGRQNMIHGVRNDARFWCEVLPADAAAGFATVRR